ncbi:MAG: hypothetical protein KatS3mg105_5005 [Gemmatales bacterium]|nr:MAG: hypothetical protein KatS3mg105_5005 [Gemmatales bacterium]
MPKTPSVGEPNRPLPNLFGRFFARIDGDVFVVFFGQASLYHSEQAAVRQNHTVRGTVHYQEASFLRDRIELKPVVIQMHFSRRGCPVPA